MKCKLTKEKWLDKALEVISHQRFGSLTIDRLVRAMGVTKGSFYWHFSSRADFIVQLITYWDNKFTQIVIEHTDNSKSDPDKQLLELVRYVTKKELSKYDFAIQAITQNEPEAFALIQNIMKKRIDYVSTLFSKIGFHGRELKFRSRLLVMFMSQQQNNLFKESTTKQLETVELAHTLLTKT